MTVEDFITQVFLGDCKRLIEARFHFFSFSIMGFGIEFLGACLDRHEFGKRKESTASFKAAMETLFPRKYRTIIRALNEDLRNGFAHQFRPGRRLELTHRDESIRLDRPHLAKRNNRICLVAEDFYDDFESACKKVIEMMRSGRIAHSKVKRHFLTVP